MRVRAGELEDGFTARDAHQHRWSNLTEHAWVQAGLESFLFGGQIKGSRMRLFMVYTAGNFIECTTDTPYLQIGEHKYGKPVLDRAMHYDVELYEALKTGLISMDSTMRSNLGVGSSHRRAGGALRHQRRRSQPPHRGGRALFPRPAFALVGGAARGASEHSTSTLQIRSRSKRSKESKKVRKHD